MTGRGRRTGARRIRRVTLWSAAANVLLAAMKIAGGVLSGSIALVADGIHTFSDLVTDIIVLVGVALGDRPPDRDHPYGHGRYETMASILISAALVVTGALLLVQVVRSILGAEKTTPGGVMVALALVSIVVKEILFQVTKKVARETRSTALVANAWHQRSDALSSLAVLLGGVAAILGLPHGDHVAGFIVGMMIVFTGFRVGLKGVSELMETGVDEKVLAEISSVLEKHPEVRDWHALRGRSVGREVFADVHVLLDPDMTVRESHCVADQLEGELRTTLHGNIHITIHVEPHGEDESSLS